MDLLFQAMIDARVDVLSADDCRSITNVMLSDAHREAYQHHYNPRAPYVRAKHIALAIIKARPAGIFLPGSALFNEARFKAAVAEYGRFDDRYGQLIRAGIRMQCEARDLERAKMEGLCIECSKPIEQCDFCRECKRAMERR